MLKLNLVVFTTTIAILFSVMFVCASDDSGKNILMYKTDGNTNSQVLLFANTNLQVIAYNLMPNTKYALAYKIERPIVPHKYGSSYTNSPTPSIICLYPNMLTDESGSISFSKKFDYTKLTKDKLNQRFFLVKASDINCRSNRVPKWDETKYQIAKETI